MKNLLIVLMMSVFSINKSVLFSQNSIKTRLIKLLKVDSMHRIYYTPNIGILAFGINATQTYLGNGLFYDFYSPNKNGVFFSNSEGFEIKNELKYDWKYFPLRATTGLNFQHGKTNIILIDSTNLFLHQSWFKNVNLISPFIGFEIRGKHWFSGLNMHYGYFFGGNVSPKFPMQINMIKNNKLHLKYPFLSTVGFRLGYQLKKFFVNASVYFGANRPIYVDYKDKYNYLKLHTGAGFNMMSINLGYNFN